MNSQSSFNQTDKYQFMSGAGSKVGATEFLGFLCGKPVFKFVKSRATVIEDYLKHKKSIRRVA